MLKKIKNFFKEILNINSELTEEEEKELVKAIYKRIREE